MPTVVDVTAAPFSTFTVDAVVGFPLQEWQACLVLLVISPREIDLIGS